MRWIYIILIALLLPGWAMAQNSTPGPHHTMVCIQPYQWGLGDNGIFMRTVCQQQGNAVTNISQAFNPGLNPGVTIDSCYTGLGGNYSVLQFDSHMSQSGTAGQTYEKSPNGLVARDADLQNLWDGGYVVYGSSSIHGYHISIYASDIPNHYVGDNSLVLATGCDNMDWVNSTTFPNSRWRGGYSQSATTVPNDMLYFASRLNGAEGKARRECTAALTNLSLEGDPFNQPTVLAPVVTSFSPVPNTILNELTGGYVRFDCTMNTDIDADWVVEGMPVFGEGDCVVEGAQWVWDNEVIFDVVPIKKGRCTVAINMNAVSADGGYNIDGNTDPYGSDGIGPNRDCYTVTLNSNVTDPNWAFGCAGAWAFNEPDGTHVLWVTDPEIGSQIFEVYGGPNRQALIATVPAEGSATTQHCYEVTIPSGYDVFEVVEQDNDPNTPDDSTRPFRLSPEPPENLESLRSMNQTVAAWPAAPNTDLEAPKPTELPLQPNPCPDIIIVSPRQDFLDATQSVQDYYRQSRGKTVVAQLLNSGNASDVIALGYQYWQISQSGTGKLLYLIGVGEANEGGEPAKNVISTVYFPDSTGVSYWSPAGSDLLLVDFDGDKLADMIWLRITAYQLVEVQNSVQTAMEFYSGQHVLSHRAFIMDGDLSVTCDPTLEPRQTLESIQQLYNQHGISTVSRHDSEYNDCGGWAERLADGSAIVNAGVGEIFGIGYTTSRSILPAFIFQKVYAPVFTMAAVPTLQRIVFQFPGCGTGDTDRDNPGNYPSFGKMWTTADPDQSATAVWWQGHMRGGYGAFHTRLAEKYMEYRFSGTCETLQEAYYYALRDLGLEEPGMRDYLLMAGSSGWIVWIDQLSVGVSEAVPEPPEARFLSNAPNPFNPNTTIGFMLSATARVELDVFNVQGRVVRSLLCSLQPAGQYTVEWDGTDNLGRRLASGNYWVRLKLNGHPAGSHQMVLVE